MASKSNIFFALIPVNFASMNESLQHLIRNIAKGDTSLAESFFRRPGGRRYLENLSIILLNTLVPHCTEKEEMYQGFVEVLDQMEERLQRREEGQVILSIVLQEGE